jgi:hypothetical protein
MVFITLLSALVGLTSQGLATGLTWVSAVPGSDRVDVYYDFRPTIFGQPNSITPAEEAVAVRALQLWSQVSNLTFIQNTAAPDSAIINIGVSPLDSSGNILGQGGYNYTNAGGFWHIAGGVADMNASDNWSLSVNSGDPAGTYNFFSVAAHEIGHAVGLEHTANAQDIMYPYYTTDKFTPSPTDVRSIQSLYGMGMGSPSSDTISTLTAVPEPSTWILVASWFIALAVRRKTGP